MKIKTGFVSNSSSCSFCVLGWDVEYGEGKEIKGLLESIIESEEGLENFYCDHTYWIGVGESEEVPTNEDGEVEYEIEEISQEKIDLLNDIVARHGLPTPTWTQGSFRNG